MRHGVLYYFVTDALADFRAWWNIERQIRCYNTRLGHLWIVLDGFFRHVWYGDSANRDHFAEIVYLVYEKNDPSRDHFLCHPSAWDGEIPSNYLIAEYRITHYPVTAGTSNEGLVSLPTRLRAECGRRIIIIRQYLWAMYADEAQMIRLIERYARGALRRAFPHGIDEFGMDHNARCGQCGRRLEIVRPGKYQCECEWEGVEP